MIVYATMMTDNDEARYGVGKACGAHFYQDIDPVNSRNKVLRINTSTTDTVLNSTTNILPVIASASGSTYEFEMRYRFDKLTWLYASKYYTLELRNESGARIIALDFELSDYEIGGPAEKIVIKQDDGTPVSGITLHCERWYKIRILYYRNVDGDKNSRLRICVLDEGSNTVSTANLSLPRRAGNITKAAIVHSATKIRGTQYFDDISFTLTDRTYSARNTNDFNTETTHRVVYDFENGIPSDSHFNIEMLLKNENAIIPFDPSTWTSGTNNAHFEHSHNFYEIMLVIRGKGTFYTQDNEYLMQPGSIFIVAPNVSHGIVAKEGYKILSISGAFDRLSFIDDIYALQDNIYNEGKKLAELILYNRFGNEDYVLSLCDAYVKYILLNLELTPKNTTASIYKIISKMEQHFGDSDLRVGGLLAESGYAEDYIRAEFLTITKMTPTKYLTNIRMKNAKTMIDLFGNDMSMSEIAERCGILDASIFSRMFKKHFGVSPTQYKNSLT